MRLNDKVRVQWAAATRELCALPDDVYASLQSNGATVSVDVQVHTQEEVAHIRAQFPGVVWNKSYNQGLSWWEYTATVRGVPIRIYAVYEGPPTCRRIEEEVEVEEDVPVQFEKRVVKRTVVRYECGEEA